MSMCPTGLYHFDPVTDTELLIIISCMNKTTCSSDPFPTRLLMLLAFQSMFISIWVFRLEIAEFPDSVRRSAL